MHRKSCGPTSGVVVDMVVIGRRQRHSPACRHRTSARRRGELRSSTNQHHVLFHLLLGSAAEPEVGAEESRQDSCVDGHRLLQTARTHDNRFIFTYSYYSFPRGRPCFEFPSALSQLLVGKKQKHFSDLQNFSFWRI